MLHLHGLDNGELLPALHRLALDHEHRHDRPVHRRLDEPAGIMPVDREVEGIEQPHGRLAATVEHDQPLVGIDHRKIVVAGGYRKTRQLHRCPLPVPGQLRVQPLALDNEWQTRAAQA